MNIHTYTHIYEFCIWNERARETICIALFWLLLLHSFGPDQTTFIYMCMHLCCFCCKLKISKKLWCTLYYMYLFVNIIATATAGHHLCLCASSLSSSSSFVLLLLLLFWLSSLCFVVVVFSVDIIYMCVCIYTYLCEFIYEVSTI